MPYFIYYIMKSLKYFGLTALVILIDQAIKFWVYYTFPYEGAEHEWLRMGDWFKLHYITNEGMAFGIEFAGQYGKLFLTSFRLLAMFGIGYYLYSLVEQKAKAGYIWCIALILGGAVGNLVDSMFYGIWFDLYTYDAPMLLFHGRVIDMFYIDICYCLIPDWVPFIGGTTYPLWPIFNFADAAIFVSVIVIVINQKKYFPEHKTEGATE
jgi:signal peptidase II